MSVILINTSSGPRCILKIIQFIVLTWASQRNAFQCKSLHLLIQVRLSVWVIDVVVSIVERNKKIDCFRLNVHICFEEWFSVKITGRFGRVLGKWKTLLTIITIDHYTLLGNNYLFFTNSYLVTTTSKMVPTNWYRTQQHYLVMLIC